MAGPKRRKNRKPTVQLKKVPNPWLAEQKVKTKVTGADAAVVGGRFVGGVFVASNTKLVGVDLTDSDLRGCQMFHCDLRGAHLLGVNVERVDLHGSDLRMCDLRDARMDRANLAECDAREAAFEGASMRLCNLEKADLRGADFYGTDLRDARMSRARLAGAHLEEADLSDTALMGATYDDQTVFPAGFNPGVRGMVINK